MKQLMIAAIVLSLFGTVFADELVLKDGKRIEWKVISDEGDTYEVTTPQGTKITVKKDDVESFTKKVDSVLTGATFTKLTKSKTLNGFALFDPKKDLFGGPDVESKFKGQTLVCDWKSDSPTRLQIPVKIPEEYDFLITIERKESFSDFYIGLIGGGIPFLVRFDADTKTGIPSWKMTDMGGQLLKKGQQSTISCYVRKDSLIVMVDKKEVVNWKGDSWKFTLPESHALPDNKVYLFLGSQKIFGTVPNLWIVHKIVLNVKENVKD